MSSRVKVIGLVAGLLTSLSVLGGTTMTNPPQATPGSPGCLERFTVDHGASVLVEQRQVGPPMSDFPTRFAAVTVEKATYAPVKVVAAFTVGGAPLLWFTPDRRSVVVDAASFSDLAVVDPTRMRVGEVATVGTVREPVRQALSGRELTRFLILAGVLRVYWHIEADVCIEAESTGQDGAYQARVSGTHVYFTNDRHEGHFAFVLGIAPDGTITVTNR
jgi:hypothetical protein